MVKLRRYEDARGLRAGVCQPPDRISSGRSYSTHHCFANAGRSGLYHGDILSAPMSLPTASIHQYPAVHIERLPGHESRCVRRQEANRSHNVLGMSQTTQRGQSTPSISLRLIRDIRLPHRPRHGRLDEYLGRYCWR